MKKVREKEKKVRFHQTKKLRRKRKQNNAFFQRNLKFFGNIYAIIFVIFNQIFAVFPTLPRRINSIFSTFYKPISKIFRFFINELRLFFLDLINIYEIIYQKIKPKSISFSLNNNSSINFATTHLRKNNKINST